MGAEVAYTTNYESDLYLMNFSVGVFTVVGAKVPRAKRNSAEWIVEAPSICTRSSCSVQPLANFGAVPFVQCTAKIDGDVGTISDDDWTNTAIIMVSESNPNNEKAVPTTLKQGGESFVVVWESAGP